MKAINLKVDADLAEEYLRKYREVFKDRQTAELDDRSLLRAFVEDRLREELEFLIKEYS